METIYDGYYFNFATRRNLKYNLRQLESIIFIYMSSYPYSIDNIRQVLNELNITGKMKREWLRLSKDEYYFDLYEARREYNEKRKEYHKKEKEEPDDLPVLKELLKQKKKDIEDITDEIVEDIFTAINRRDARIKYTEHLDEPKKPLFEVVDRDSYFICKLIMKELNKVYKVKTFSRDSIMSDLSMILKDPCDKTIIRTDVKSFFESIPRDVLLNKIEQDGIICSKTVKILKRLDYDLTNDTNPYKGVPRGLSFASVLSEIYLREVDRRINKIKGLYFYRRFVDDIVIVAYNNGTKNNPIDLFNQIAIFFEKKRLSLHRESDHDGKYYCTSVFYGKEGDADFNYLGYHIRLENNGNISFSLSNDKFQRYIESIDRILSFYADHAFIKPKARQKGEKCSKCRHSQPIYKLYVSLNFLTRNYRLSGKKTDVKSGIFFKHRQLTNLSQLRQLDEYLYEEVKKYITPKRILCNKDIPKDFCDNIAKKIKDNYSFENGFSERRMCYLSSSDIKSAKWILKYDKI